MTTIFTDRLKQTYLGICLTLYESFITFGIPKKRPVENIMGKGKNAGNQHFLLFLQCFLHFERQYFGIIIVSSSLTIANLQRLQWMKNSFQFFESSREIVAVISMGTNPLSFSTLYTIYRYFSNLCLNS